MINFGYIFQNRAANKPNHLDFPCANAIPRKHSIAIFKEKLFNSEKLTDINQVKFVLPRKIQDSNNLLGKIRAFSHMHC
jgi:hypothetical protein